VSSGALNFTHSLARRELRRLDVMLTFTTVADNLLLFLYQVESLAIFMPRLCRNSERRLSQRADEAANQVQDRKGDRRGKLRHSQRVHGKVSRCARPVDIIWCWALTYKVAQKSKPPMRSISVSSVKMGQWCWILSAEFDCKHVICMSKSVTSPVTVLESAIWIKRVTSYFKYQSKFFQ